MKHKETCDTRAAQFGWRAVAVAIAAILFTPIVAMAAPAGMTGKALLFLQSAIPVSADAWVPVAIVAVITIIVIAAVVYELSALLQSPYGQAWARSQVYEGILSIILLLIFVALLGIAVANPQPAFASANLVPNSGPYNCTSAQDLFQLAACDVSVFNGFAFGIFEALFYVGYMSGIAPGVQIQVQLGLPNIEFVSSMGVNSFIPVYLPLTLSMPSFAIATLLLLNQIQLLILSGSLLWLSFFITLGLIARTIGFTRTFGGAMIALGLGLGFVYPLLSSITYGYVDYQLGAQSSCGSSTCTAAVFASDLLNAALGVITGQGLPGTDYTVTVNGITQSNWLFQFAAAMAGLTFIPFLNFTILDAFIVDFSRAVGERLDFATLLAGVV